MKSKELQLEFDWRDQDVLRAELEFYSGLRIHLTVTDNTRSVLSVRRAVFRQAIKVRLHHMFLGADRGVIQALANWLRTARTSPPAQLVTDFIRQHEHQVRSQTERPDLATRGNVFDLVRIFDELNAEYFQNRVTAAVTWGRMPPARRRCSIRFGSYTPSDNVIRIHPLLDQSFIPPFFMRYIMFHEMLHAYLGIRQTNGRRLYHSAEFVQREKAYPDYDRAIEWQNTSANLNRLLSYR